EKPLSEYQYRVTDVLYFLNNKETPNLTQTLSDDGSELLWLQVESQIKDLTSEVVWLFETWRNH
ncbi:hypothetical protein, partial [Klebsiella pneumoniae]|uniref:hypothetical protein n=1 Tax=Klebsiella pneumoniae TaxID=573 RepID=UPI001C8F8A11